MKIFFAVLISAFVANKSCNKSSTGCYKGRLETKGICMNYTIKLLDGNIDSSKINTKWTDEHTGIEHTNVFALGSPCSFPASIKEGEEFYFVLDDTKQDCAVCKAYYPKPPKSLNIKVVSQPCTK